MSTARSVDANNLAQVVRFIVNGVLAAIVHYAVLTLNLKVVHIPSAGIASLLAAVVGITSSFFGSRYFVFRAQDEPIAAQFAKFGLLYTCVAMLHATVLWMWTDVNGLDYRIGFLLATALQTILSFVGNKILVFKQ